MLRRNFITGTITGILSYFGLNNRVKSDDVKIILPKVNLQIFQEATNVEVQRLVNEHIRSRMSN